MSEGAIDRLVSVLLKTALVTRPENLGQIRGYLPTFFPSSAFFSRLLRFREVGLQTSNQASPSQAPQRTQSLRRETPRSLCALCACGGEGSAHCLLPRFVNLLF